MCLPPELMLSWWCDTLVDTSGTRLWISCDLPVGCMSKSNKAPYAYRTTGVRAAPAARCSTDRPAQCIRAGTSLSDWIENVRRLPRASTIKSVMGVFQPSGSWSASSFERLRLRRAATTLQLAAMATYCSGSLKPASRHNSTASPICSARFLHGLSPTLDADRVCS